MDHYDLIVIGAGPAGEKGAAQAAYFGRRVAIVENQAQPGGAAAINAWVPSKTLREAALYLTGFQTRDAYEGLSLGLDPKFAVNRLRARAAAVVKAITGEVRTNIEAHGIQLVHGTARLAADKHVHVTTPDGSQRELHGDATTLEVVQRRKRERPPSDHRVADVEERLAPDHAASHELAVVGQPEVRVASIGQERAAHRPPAVVGRKPRVVGAKPEPARDELGELDVESALRTFGAAERQVVRIGAHTERVGRSGRHNHT